MIAPGDVFTWRRFALTCFKAGWLAKFPSVMDEDDERRCEAAFAWWYDKLAHGRHDTSHDAQA